MKKVLLLLLLVLLPSLALAEENFSLTISEQVISSLTTTNPGVLSATSLVLPTRQGSKQLQLFPIEIRSSDYKSFLSTPNGRVEDKTKVSLFRGEAKEKNSGQLEFYRFALIDDGKNKPYLDGYFLQKDPITV